MKIGYQVKGLPKSHGTDKVQIDSADETSSVELKERYMFS
jgi:hypothetical protein